MSTGQMNFKLSFQKRIVLADDYGNEESDFAEVFIRSAQIKPSLGIETVAAARLAGQQPVDIIVYRDSDTRQIAADWRAVDANEGTVYALTSSPIDIKQDRKFLTIKAISGVAQ